MPLNGLVNTVARFEIFRINEGQPVFNRVFARSTLTTMPTIFMSVQILSTTCGIVASFTFLLWQDLMTRPLVWKRREPLLNKHMRQSSTMYGGELTSTFSELAPREWPSFPDLSEQVQQSLLGWHPTASPLKAISDFDQACPAAPLRIAPVLISGCVMMKKIGTTLCLSH